MIWLRIAATIAVLIAAMSATGEPVSSIVGAVVFALPIRWGAVKMAEEAGFEVL
jgi:hypothetical protein